MASRSGTLAGVERLLDPDQKISSSSFAHAVSTFLRSMVHGQASLRRHSHPYAKASRNGPRNLLSGDQSVTANTTCVKMPRRSRVPKPGENPLQCGGDHSQTRHSPRRRELALGARKLMRWRYPQDTFLQEVAWIGADQLRERRALRR